MPLADLKKMDSTACMAIEDRHESGVYTKRPLAIVRGRGAYLWDAANNRYVDCGASYGVMNVGHANPAVAEALRAQSEKLTYVSSLFYNETRARLIQKLVEITPRPLQRVFLANSGTEANEAAIKFARQATGRAGVVSAKKGFHGRTMGALSATPNPKYQDPFQPLVPGFTHCVFNDVDSLTKAVTRETAAVILEPVQGEGGITPATREFLNAARDLTSDVGAFLVLDEVQTGFGRTGKLFALEHFDVQPDMMTLAKSLGGGLPVGACLMTDAVAAGQGKATHGSTFGGGPLASAAALAAIEYTLEKDLPRRAAELGSWFMDRLRRIDHPVVREVRGIGLMIGVDLKVKPFNVLTRLLAKNVLALPAGATMVRFLPPLVIERDDLDLVADALEESLEGEGPEKEGAAA